jgi:hypothetical protein
MMQAKVIARKVRQIDMYSSHELPMTCADMTINEAGLSLLLQDTDLAAGDIVKVEIVFANDYAKPLTH